MTELAEAHAGVRVAVWRTLFAAAALFGLLLTFAVPEPAQALPAFARQTGQPCANCHTIIPELRPFGRRFKLGGYQLTGGDYGGLPLATFVQAGFTHTAAPNDNPPAGFHPNNNVAVQQVSQFLAGKLADGLGCFCQVQFDAIGQNLAWDQSDLRYVKHFDLGGDKDLYIGFDVNNTPTVEDVWNSSNAFSYPQISTGLGGAYAGYGAPGSFIDSVALNVLGAGVYAFYDDMFYANFTLYHGLGNNVLNFVGEPNNTSPYASAMPYWRLAFEPHWGDHYLMVGTYGMYGQVTPNGLSQFGTDSYLDFAVDAQYQYDGDPFSLTIKATNIHEWQRFGSSFAQTLASNTKDWQNNLNLNATFAYDHHYLLGAGYFDVTGSSDPFYDTGLYGGPGNVNSLNGNGMILEAAYSPFMYGSQWPYTTYNARIGLQYTHYFKVFGGDTNFDGTNLGGQHNASGNDSLFLYAWVVF